MDRFDNMRVFAKVVENGSFAAAAARLSISASMASLHVKALEERLGARLLNRTTRRVSVTEIGRAFYERCTRLLADLEEAERSAGDMQTAPRGDLRVNAPPCLGACFLGPAIADFATRFPAISAELMLSDRPVDLVDEAFDIAVRIEPLPDSSLIARRLGSCRLVICGAPGYFEAHGTPRTPADLTHHSCLVLTGSSFFRRWHLRNGDGTELHVSLAGNIRANHPTVLMHAALAGHGIVYAPTYLVGEALRTGRLVTVLDDYALPPLTVRALYPHNRHLSAKVRAFVDFLVARFEPESPWDDPVMHSSATLGVTEPSARGHQIPTQMMTAAAAEG
jgi:DNA-binding transcriptional LysR family regulator